MLACIPTSNEPTSPIPIESCAIALTHFIFSHQQEQSIPVCVRHMVNDIDSPRLLLKHRASVIWKRISMPMSGIFLYRKAHTFGHLLHLFVCKLHALNVYGDPSDYWAPLTLSTLCIKCTRFIHALTTYLKFCMKHPHSFSATPNAAYNVWRHTRRCSVAFQCRGLGQSPFALSVVQHNNGGGTCNLLEISLNFHCERFSLSGFLRSPLLLTQNGQILFNFFPYCATGGNNAIA